MKVRRNLFVSVCSSFPFIIASTCIGIFDISPALASHLECKKVFGRNVCVTVPDSPSDLDPTTGIPGSREVAEQAWGEAGAAAYQAAAGVMRGRNGGSQGLDESQKRYLRPHFGDLVDRVAVIYGAQMLDQWSAFGKEINLSGVDTAAQTYCNRIYVRDSYKPNDFQQLVTLSHEMTHSKQCEELGGEGKFGFHYFREFKRAGQNYENNKLEQEAYSFATQFASEIDNPANSGSPVVAANPLATGEYYIRRVGEHCKWLLTHTGLTPEWQLIQSSAQKDAGNTDSEYYRNCLAGHCQYFLSHTDRTDKWNLIEDSARKDAGIPLVSSIASRMGTAHRYF